MTSRVPTDLERASSGDLAARYIVARWPARHAADALGLRTLVGAKIAMDEHHAWLRLAPGTKEFVGLAGLRGLEVFVADPGTEPELLRARLTDGAAVASVPTARLPEGEALRKPWGLLAEWRTPRLAEALGSGMAAAHGPGDSRVDSPGMILRTVRGGAPRPAAALRLPLARLMEWADLAPERRLRDLVFAVHRGGEALVLRASSRSTPLPPAPGRLYWLDPWGGAPGAGALLVPCGQSLAPALPASAAFEVLRRSTVTSGLGELKPDDHVAFDEAGWSVVPASSWVRMSRSALRESLAGLAAREGGVER